MNGHEIAIVIQETCAALRAKYPAAAVHDPGKAILYALESMATLFGATQDEIDARAEPKESSNEQQGQD